MQEQRGLSSKLFRRYSDKDAFTKSFSKFLFIINVIFFILMGLLFLVNIGKHGFLYSFATNGTSCISAMLAMYLIVKGEPRKAGTLFVVFQTCIIFLGGFMRQSELNLMTIAYFGFPTILLAVVFTNRLVHISVSVILAAGLLGNLAKFNEAAVTITPEIVRDMVTRSTVASLVTFIILYCIAVVTVRSLNLSLKISMNEKSASDDKNKYIMELIDTIRRSYAELTGAMGVTDEAMTGIFANIQTEAATIEELVASIEEISSTTTSVEHATRDQNSSVNELSSSINSLSSLIDSLTVFGNDLQNEFGAITRMAAQGRSASGELEEVNSKTLVNSDNMQSITGIIDDFFDRINLLSLNASIEAARAGEHGRGFAVVADEIGKLADNSSSELKKIKDLIETSRADVAFSSTIIGKIISFIESLDGSLARVQGKAMETLGVISNQKNVQGEMIGRNRSVFEKSEFIKDASAEQSIAIQEIAKSIENTNMLVQENSRNAESLSEGYVKMKRIADDLKRIMNENS